jgi:hypothetical protein
MFGLKVMTLSQMGVVAGLLVSALFMVLRGQAVMPSGMFVVLSRLAVMVSVLLRHGSLPFAVFRAQLLFTILARRASRQCTPAAPLWAFINV